MHNELIHILFSTFFSIISATFLNAPNLMSYLKWLKIEPICKTKYKTKHKIVNQSILITLIRIFGSFKGKNNKNCVPSYSRTIIVHIKCASKYIIKKLCADLLIWINYMIWSIWYGLCEMRLIPQVCQTLKRSFDPI